MTGACFWGLLYTSSYRRLVRTGLLGPSSGSRRYSHFDLLGWRQRQDYRHWARDGLEKHLCTTGILL